MVEPVDEEDEDDEEDFDADVSRLWQMPQERQDTPELYIHLSICCCAMHRTCDAASSFYTSLQFCCPRCMHVYLAQGKSCNVAACLHLQFACC